MFPLTMHRFAVVAIIPVVPLLLLATRPAPERVRVGGTFTMNYTQRHPLPIDAEGHALIATESKGINRSTGATGYMDRAEVRNVEIADLTRGSGRHQGYVTFSLNGEQDVNMWSGQVTTTLTRDQKPVTTFAGTWSKAKGPSGHGTYNGRLTGPDSFTVEWEGELELREPTASR